MIEWRVALGNVLIRAGARLTAAAEKFISPADSQVLDQSPVATVLSLHLAGGSLDADAPVSATSLDAVPLGQNPDAAHEQVRQLIKKSLEEQGISYPGGVPVLRRLAGRTGERA
jgi:hypothetical protein